MTEHKQKLVEIMQIANKLKWFAPNPSGYPMMQASEVEKCILMALDDRELERFRDAAEHGGFPAYVPV